MRHTLIVLIAVCCFAAFSFSQTADELIAKNIQARGGMEKMKAIKNFRMTGRFEAAEVLLRRWARSRRGRI